MHLGGKPNYVLPHKKEGDAPSGPKPEPGQSKEDAAAAKAAYMAKYQVNYDACQLINNSSTSVAAIVGGHGSGGAEDAHQGHARADLEAGGNQVRHGGA